MATTDERPEAYKIILSDDPDELAAAVEASFAQGWVLQGGIAIAFDPREPLQPGKIPCAQAMVRYSNFHRTEG